VEKVCTSWSIIALNPNDTFFTIVYSLALDLDRHQVFSGSMDGTIRCWDINNGNCKSVMQGHTSLVGLLSLSSSYLVSGSADAVVFVWNPSTQELCHKFTGHKGAVTALHNSDLRVISGDESALSLWNVKDGSDLINLSLPDMEGVWQVALEGNWCAAAVHGRSVGTQLAVWDLSDSHDDRETFV
jgi:F-box and WD-40 domain protein CDC4